MTNTIWTPTLAWLAAAIGALMLAIATPSESNVMGRLPSPTAKRLEQQLFAELPNGRTLALVGFNKDQRVELHSWIDGLRLRQNSPIAWVKMPVLKDPGNDDARSVIESQLLAGHALKGHPAPLIPVFANQDDFIRAAGLSGKDHASVLVLNRDGRVLARAEGRYDPAKADALRETLAGQGD
ncbi:MAG: hypothetical protein ABI409_00185 [Ramlibacter sp.]